LAFPRKAPRAAGPERAKPLHQLHRGLEDVIGHLPVVASTRYQLATRTLSHAYWVSGPPQVGKTTLALSVATEFLSATEWPGGLLSHPDVWVEDGDGSISIKRIRAHSSEADPEEGPTLQHFLSLSAFAGSGKVAVIGNAERLTIEAANSLLRLLEEPTPNSVIWLCTSRPESEHLPSTLRSRCQQLLLGGVETGAISKWLVEVHHFGEEAARVAAAICLGRPGLALEMARDPELERRAADQLNRFLACADQGPYQWLELSRELAERGTSKDLARGALRVWASFLRDCCSQAVGAAQLSRWPDQQELASLWAGRFGPEGCSRRYDLALDALARLDEMATPRLVLDRFLLLTFGEKIGSPEEDGSQPVLSAIDQR
jgi:hypothetical protein